MTFNKSKYQRMSLDELNEAASKMHADRKSDPAELAYVNSLRRDAYLGLEAEERANADPNRPAAQTVTPNGITSSVRMRQKGE